MELIDNPFHVLGAQATSTKGEIMDLYQEKSLFLDSDICTQARLILTNPKKRLSAEVSWLFLEDIENSLPDEDEHSELYIDVLGDDIEFTPYQETFEQWTNLLNHWWKTALYDEYDGYLDVSQLSLLYLSIANLGGALCHYFAPQVTYAMLDLLQNSDSQENNERLLQCAPMAVCWAFYKSDADWLYEAFNDQRLSADINEIDSESDVQDALSERQQELLHDVMQIFNRMPSHLVSRILSRCVKAFDNKFDELPTLMRLVVEQYALSAKTFMQDQLVYIDKALNQAVCASLYGLPNKMRDDYVQMALNASTDYVRVLSPIDFKSCLDGADYDSGMVQLINSWQELSGLNRAFFSGCFKSLKTICAELHNSNVDREIDEIIDTVESGSDKIGDMTLFPDQPNLIFSERYLLYAGKKHWWFDLSRIFVAFSLHSMDLIFVEDGKAHTFTISEPNTEVFAKALALISTIALMHTIIRWEMCLKRDVPIDFNGMTIWDEGVEIPQKNQHFRWNQLDVECSSSSLGKFCLRSRSTGQLLVYLSDVSSCDNFFMFKVLAKAISLKPKLLSDALKDCILNDQE